MEWFDFGLYAYLAVILSQLFFSGVDNSGLQLVLTFGTFAAAFSFDQSEVYSLVE